MIMLLITYPVLAHFGPKEGRAEFYPFFDWSLFTYASNIRKDVVLIVREIDEKPLAEPTYFFDMPTKFSTAKKRDSAFGKFLDDYAFAHLGGQTEREMYLENILANRYLSEASSIKFDLAVITYDPIQRYKTGDVLKTTTLKSVEISK